MKKKIAIEAEIEIEIKSTNERYCSCYCDFINGELNKCHLFQQQLFFIAEEDDALRCKDCLKATGDA